ncbi:MAG: 23S rRNA (pseudouridine(1915)-N(3))-methyltransferase RlmH [Syntrophomonadaceae bacterium]|jgi:23S rRNA (pseudouridine1915-N3)-methyltransferase|nr:23S rRNA (pseudouridine(1915)-N(3))-methyltransferase RlmH [Syntrophomonadaceae bacterium]
MERIMKYRIISVGKIREPFYQAGIKEYMKRLSSYGSIELLEGLEEKTRPRAGEKEIEKILQKEGEKILGLLGKDELLVAFDIAGKQMNSTQLADCINDWNHSGKNRVNLVIGGSHGLSTQVKKAADQAISFSPLTFPHQMAVLMLVEQLYRGFKIIKGEKYHK